MRGRETQKDTGYNHNSLSVSHWGSPNCRWWRGWRSKPRCTRGHCRSAWSCWWTRCRCCWCSRHSYSCPSPSLRFQTPTRRLSPSHRAPRERTVHSDKRKMRPPQTLSFIHSFMPQTTTIEEEQNRISFNLNGNPNYRRANSFQGSFQKGPIKTQRTSQRPGWSLSKLKRAKYHMTARQYKKALYNNSSLQ